MDLSFISIKQQLSANIESQGLQSTISAGGTHDIKGNNGATITSSSADIIYTLKLKSRHASNTATLNLKTNFVSDTGNQIGSSALHSSQPFGKNAIGPDGDEVGTSNSTAVALYIESDKDNTGDVQVAGNVDYLPDLTFKGTNSDKTVRSALFNIQQSTSGTEPVLTFSFTAIGDKVEVIYLAKAT
mgnify:FL=1|tara:strand:- start:3236 stop:3793 length:558 start_codon:yes stop_codon:yes gene_type:complete